MTDEISIPRQSYHADILDSARIAELNRAKVYTQNQAEMVILTRKELLYLQGAEYKLGRVELQTKDPMKALDDIRDAYNYCALLFRELKIRYPAAYEELLKQQ